MIDWVETDLIFELVRGAEQRMYGLPEEKFKYL